MASVYFLYLTATQLQYSSKLRHLVTVRLAVKKMEDFNVTHCKTELSSARECQQQW